MNGAGHRDQLSVMADILRVAADQPLKTRIMYKANLSHRQLMGYLNRLIEMGLLAVAADPANGRLRYRVTEKGLQFLKDYSKLNRLFSR